MNKIVFLSSILLTNIIVGIGVWTIADRYFVSSTTTSNDSPITTTDKSISSSLDNDSGISTDSTENSSVSMVSETAYTTYTNSEYNFAISYPDSYEVVEDFMGTVVAFTSPIADETDIFSENVSVLVQDLSAQPMNLDEYVALSNEQLQQFVTDIDILSSQRTTLDGYEAHEMIFTGQQGMYKLQRKIVATIVDSRAYVVTATTQVNDTTYTEIFDTMIDSFVFVGA